MLILITTVWTFCFTRRVIFKIKQQNSTSSEDGQNHLYVRRIKKWVDVFGLILAGTILTFLPGILVATIEAVVDGAQPKTIFTTA